MHNISPVADLIQNRRTIKNFKVDSISVEQICELLNVAVWAPNHGLREPWRFILFVEDGKNTLVDAIMQNAVKKKDQEAYMKVPAYLAVIVHEDPRYREREEDMLAAGALIQNFQLAAWEQGIGCIWLTEPFMHQPGFRTSIGMKPGEKLIGLLKIGYPESIPEPRARTAAEEKLTVVRSL